MADSKQWPVVDCQVHCYERDRPERPWAGTLHGPAEVTGDDMVAFMDRMDIDGAILVSPWVMYRYDASYALEVQARHPGRYGLVKPFDPNEPDVANEMADWAGKPGVVGARLMMGAPGPAISDPGGVDRIMSAAADNGLPVNVLCWGNLDAFADVAARHANTRLVVDHLGLLQPFEPPVPKQPWRDLATVLGLAQLDNVVIKVSGACTLSHQPFPFDDIWEPLARIFDAYGFERCMWGTDWTRAVDVCAPEDSVEAFRVTERLSEDERAALMGGSLAQIYDWTPSRRGAG
jgi:predicted TIM-barrel fold metal-dependent hydrolase